MDIDKDSAQVKVPPPMMLLLSVITGWLIQWVYPLYLGFIPSDVRFYLGILMIGMGVGTPIYCLRAFKKVQTNIEPWKPTTNIITTGIFGLSRNPIYTAFIVGGLGIALVSNNLWIAIMQIVLFVALTKLVIEKEETYLAGKFGDEYLNYKKSVRRWI